MATYLRRTTAGDIRRYRVLWVSSMRE